MNRDSKNMSEETALAILIASVLVGVVLFSIIMGLLSNFWLSIAVGIIGMVLAFYRMVKQWEGEA